MNNPLIRRKIENMLGEKPVQIRNLTDGESNQVFCVDEKYILKNYLSDYQRRREVSGLLLVGALSNLRVPLLVAQDQNTVLLEYIGGSSSAFKSIAASTLTKAELAVVVASFMADIYRSYRQMPRSKLQLMPFITFNARLNRLVELFAQNQEVLAGLIGRSELNEIKNALDILISKQNSYQNMTLLHCDLNSDNVVLTEQSGVREFVPIDFEHFMEGPIELEFQNSLLWDDEKSLDVKRAVQSLRSDFNVPYDLQTESELKVFYLIDQLNMAIESGNFAKVHVLMGKYRKALK